MSTHIDENHSLSYTAPVGYDLIYRIHMRCVAKDMGRQVLIGKGDKARVMQYTDPDYIKALNNFRRQIGRQGIPTQLIPRIRAAGKNKPVRNIKIDWIARVIGYTALDKSNVEGFIHDALQPEKRQGRLPFRGVYENDWQVWDGRGVILNNQPVDLIEVFIAIEDEPCLEPTQQLNLWEMTDVFDSRLRRSTAEISAAADTRDSLLGDQGGDGRPLPDAESDGDGANVCEGAVGACDEPASGYDYEHEGLSPGD